MYKLNYMVFILNQAIQTSCIKTIQKKCKTKNMLNKLSKLSVRSNNVHYLFCSKLVLCEIHIMHRILVYLQTLTTITFFYFSEFGVNYVFQGFRQVKVQSLKLA